MIKMPLSTCKAYWIIPPVKQVDSCNEIIDKACDFFKIPRKILLSPKRDKFLVLPRFMIMHSLIHNYRIRTGVTHVARLFNRDHSTIVKGMKSLDNLLATDEFYRKELQRLHEYLYGHVDYLVMKGSIKKVKTIGRISK